MRDRPSSTIVHEPASAIKTGLIGGHQTSLIKDRPSLRGAKRRSNLGTFPSGLLRRQASSQ
ncbi:MAG: hypothetical protein LBT00_04125 [Spirochaetaceae bacterium]|nr:hypothetical protein [Spirochaetaceae bacterium]